MKLLLDTQAFLWFVDGDPRLSGRARRRIEDLRHDKRVSIATIWEAAIKVSLGKLRLSLSMGELVEAGVYGNGFALLPVEVEHTARVATLPRHHGDPFDRMLIAQALTHDLTVVGSDDAFDHYGVKRLW